MKREPIAIIDVGSNSIKLLVAEAQDGRVHPLEYQSKETRISTGIGQASMELSDEALEAGVQSVSELLESARAFEPRDVRIVATSAVREAVNRDVFKERIHAATGYELSVLTGKEEALGIARGISTDPGLSDIPSFCVFDLGGGSLELIEYTKGDVRQAMSLPIGAVRLMELFVKDVGSAMTAEVADQVADYVQKTVKESGFVFPESTAGILVGTGGAVTVTRAMINFKRKNRDEPRFNTQELEQLFRFVAPKTLEDRLKIRGLPEKRADIYPCALAAVITLMRLARCKELHHSYHNLRFGLAAEMLFE